MRTLALLTLLCLGAAAYIVGFDKVPQASSGVKGASQAAAGYCNPPEIAGTINAASDSTTVSPGSVAVIFWCDNSVSLPASPITSVLVNGAPSYLYPPPATPVTSMLANSQSSYLQLLVQLPVQASAGTKLIQLKRNTQVVAESGIDLSAFAPGIFTVNKLGTGLAVAEHSNGSAVTAACPANPGEAVTIYAEGLGPTTPPVATGELPPFGQLTSTNTLPAVTVGASDASVLFAILSFNVVGVYQVNFVVPAVGAGQMPLQIQIGQQSSNTAQLPVGPNSCAP